MNYNLEHIYKGIGWYLYNGKFIENNHNKIIFVGTLENMNNDLKKINKLLNLNINNNPIRQNKNKNNKYLSKLAIDNIKKFYENTDYKALKSLLKYNFITQKTYDEYQNYTT